MSQVCQLNLFGTNTIYQNKSIFKIALNMFLYKKSFYQILFVKHIGYSERSCFTESNGIKFAKIQRGIQKL